MKKMLLSMLCLGAMTAYAGNGTEASPYTVAEVIAMGTDLNVESATVQGYIVGNAPGQAISSAIFTATGASASNVLIADSKTETDVAKCVPIQLVAGSDIRNAVNLRDNPANLGKTLTITGQLIKYFSVPGVKAPTAYKLEGADNPDVPTLPDVVTTLNEGFDTGIPANWKNVKASGDKEWYQTNYNGNGYAAATGYKGTQPPYDEWLITPAIDLSKVDSKVLTFDTQVNGYGSTTTVFEVYVLTSDDPATAGKTKLNPSIAVAPATGYSSWVASGDLDISSLNLTGNIYFGFRYYATQDENYATWCVDNVKFNAGATPQPTVAEVSSIAEFLEKQLTTPVRFNFPVTAIYQNKSYLYVTDGTTPLLIYGQCGQTYKNGDVIPAGIVGTFQNYSNGQLQLSSIDATTFQAGTAGTAVTPEVYQLEELSTDMVSAYIKVLGVTLAAGADEKTFVISDGTLEMNLYNQFGVTLSAGTYDAFEGFVAIHSGNMQVLPIIDMGVNTPEPPVESDENIANFFAPEYVGLPGCALINADGSYTGENKDASKSLVGLSFTEKGVTLAFSVPEGAEYFTGSYGNQVRWYQGNICTLTPGAGVTIKKVFVKTVSNSKGAFTTSEGDVEGSGEGASNPITWTGSATTPLVLTADKAIRFSYMEVTTEGYVGGVEDVNVDNANAPVEYFNLQGIRVNNPQGGIFIRRQGNEVSKVLVK